MTDTERLAEIRHYMPDQSSLYREDVAWLLDLISARDAEIAALKDKHALAELLLSGDFHA